MRKNRFKTRDIVLLGIVLVILVAMLGTFLIFFQANLPRMKAQSETEKVASQYAQVTQVEEFFQYTRKQTYYTVVGKTANQEKKIVIVPKSGDKITVLNAKDCINQGQAEATILDRHKDIKSIKSATIGIYDNKPVWELVGVHKNGEITFFLLGLKDGQDVGETKTF